MESLWNKKQWLMITMENKFVGITVSATLQIWNSEEIHFF